MLAKNTIIYKLLLCRCVSFLFRSKRRRIGDDLQSGSKMIKMGNPELTALWNLNPNNMEACKSGDRYATTKYLHLKDESVTQCSSFTD